MSVTYAKAPLVELVAELRWNTPGVQVPAVGSTLTIAMRGPELKDEELFMQYGAVASAKGFGRFERLIPAGFPIASFQPVCRYRPTDPEAASPLYQLGAGIFSANAVPPHYKSWKDFSPRVLEGLQMLENACKNVGRKMPVFNTAIIRYIDAFHDDLTGDMPPLKFLADVLGFKIELPDALMKACVDENKVFPHIQLSVPVAPGQMNLVLAHGTVQDHQAVIMDTTVVISREIGPLPETAIDVLTEARGVVHDFFRGVTSKLHEAMKPQ